MVIDIIFSDIEASSPNHLMKILILKQMRVIILTQTQTAMTVTVKLKVDPLLLQVNLRQKAALVTRNHSTLYSIINHYYSCPYVWLAFSKMWWPTMQNVEACWQPTSNVYVADHSENGKASRRLQGYQLVFQVDQFYIQAHYLTNFWEVSSLLI